jgi:hypothetical protein
MDGRVWSVWTLLVTSGLICGALAPAVPATPATDRDAPNFAVAVTFSSDQGGQSNSSVVNSPVNISANVTIAQGQPNVTNLYVRLVMDGNQFGIDEALGALRADQGAVFTWQWTPSVYGDIFLEVTAFNDTDHANQTAVTSYFRALSSNITIDSVALGTGRALIGVDHVNVTAPLRNSGNLDGLANVSFMLDGSLPLGNVLRNVPAGGNAAAVLMTDFSGLVIADGNHTVTAYLKDLFESAQTSGNITLINPVPDILVVGLKADPSSIEVGKDETVDVDITATLANNGTAADRDFPVSFYDSLARLGEVAVNVSLAPGSTVDVSFVWPVTDSVLPGAHTLLAGVGDEDALKGHRLSTGLSIDGVANVTIDGLEATPPAGMEGANVTFTARLFNNGTKGASGLSFELYDGAALIARMGNITIEKEQILDEILSWTLPDVDQDSVRIVRATVGGASRTVNVTVTNRAPRIEILSLDVPDGLRIGYTVNITATVKNSGNGDAAGLTMDFFDSGDRMATSAPFNLTVGSSRDVTVTATISGAADQDHNFSAESLGAGKNITRAVGHRLAPARVVFQGLTVNPKSRDNQPKGSEQSYTLTVMLRNTGEVRSSNCTLTMMDGKKAIAVENIVLDGGKYWNKTYIWKVRGTGDHKAVATLAGADAGAPGPQEAKCSLNYTPGFDMLCLLAAAMVALAMARRKAR